MEEISKDVFDENLKCYRDFRRDVANCLNAETFVFKSIFDGHVYWVKTYKSKDGNKRITVADMFFDVLKLFNMPTDVLSSSAFILFDKRYKNDIVELLDKYKVGKFVLYDRNSSYEVYEDE